MKQLLKIVISFFVTIVITSLFLVFGESGLFRWLESSFYNPRLQKQFKLEVDAVTKKIITYHNNYFQRFKPVLEYDFIITSFLTDQSTLQDDITRRNSTFELYKTEYKNLLFIRFIGNDNKRIHFSTLATDTRARENNQIIYYNYDQLEEAVPAEKLAVLKDEKPKLTIDAKNNRFIYSFPITDKFGIYKGTALFYIAKQDLETYLLMIPDYSLGSEIALVNAAGILINFPQDKIDLIKDVINEKWTLNQNFEPIGIKVVLESIEKKYILFTSNSDDLGRIGVLVDSRQFEIQFSFKVILIILAGLTVFLLIYLLLNIKQDPLMVLSYRIKQFEINMLKQLFESEEKIDWLKWKKELILRSNKIKTNIKKGIRYPKKYEADIENLINKSWDEILNTITIRIQNNAQGLQQAEVPPQIDLSKIEEIISNALRKTPLVVSAIETKETGLKVKTGMKVTPPVKDDAGDVEEIEEAGEAEEVEEIEEAAEAEEVEEVEEAGEAEEVEEVEEAGEAEEVEEVEEAGEAEEVEEVEEVGEAEETEEVEEAGEDEEVEEVEEAGEDEEVEEVEEAGEAEETEEVEEAGEAEETEEVEEVGEDEEIEVEEAGEDEETEEVEETGEAEEIEEVEEAGEDEEVEEVEEAGEAEEVEEVEEAGEAEEIEEVEEAGEDEEVEEVEEAGEDEEVEEVESAEDDKALSGVNEITEIEEIEEFENIEEVDAQKGNGKVSINKQDEKPGVSSTTPGQEDEVFELEEALDPELEAEQVRKLNEIEGVEEIVGIEKSDLLPELEEFTEEPEVDAIKDNKPDEISNKKLLTETDKAKIKNIFKLIDQNLEKQNDRVEKVKPKVKPKPVEHIEELESVMEIVPLPPLEFEQLEELDIIETDESIQNLERGFMQYDAPDFRFKELAATDKNSSDNKNIIKDTAITGHGELKPAKKTGKSTNKQSGDMAALANQKKENIVQKEKGSGLFKAAVIEKQKEQNIREEQSSLSFVDNPELSGLMASGIIREYTVSNLKLIIDEIRKSVVESDGIFQIKDELYKINKENPDDIKNLLFYPKLKKVKDKKKIFFTLNGLEYDRYLQDNKYGSDIISRMKSLVEFSREINAVNVGILCHTELVYELDISVGLTEKCQSSLIFEKDHPFVGWFFNKKKVVIINKPLNEVDSLKNKFTPDDLKVIQAALFIPAVYKAKNAIIFVGFHDNKERKINEIVEELNIF